MAGSVPTVVFVAALVSVGYPISRSLTCLKNSLPPGPRRWPLIGSVLKIPQKHQWVTFSKWSKTYERSPDIQLDIKQTIHSKDGEGDCAGGVEAWNQVSRWVLRGKEKYCEGPISIVVIVVMGAEFGRRGGRGFWIWFELGLSLAWMDDGRWVEGG
ncbi:hypothetical protein B0H14DRAFT_3141668 [Mycena olivaceomarginata]|nr:hypothetical protein B0H14DRAFT_3141668 [Mycena olivaceomarginata]